MSERGFSNWLHTFYYVANSGSFTEAANKLRASRAVVTNHISALEQEFGISLINRTTRSFSLTQEGELLFDKSQQLHHLLEATKGLLGQFQNKSEGILKLKIPTALDNPKFHQLLARYKAANKDVTLDVYAGNEIGDLVSEGLDIALTLGEIKDCNYICRRIWAFDTFVVASPAYWRDNGIPSHPEQLSQYRCINYRHCKTGEKWSFTENGKAFLVDVSNADVCDSDDMMISFAAAGMGVARALDFMCQQQIKRGELLPVLKTWADKTPLYAVTPKREIHPLRVKNFIESLIKLVPTTFMP